MAFAKRIPSALLPRLIQSRPSFTITPFNLADDNLPSPAAATANKAPTPPILDLDDARRLYVSVKTGALLRSLATLYGVALGPAVDLGMAIMRSPAVMENRAARAVVMEAVRRTVYRQFCAGDDADQAAETLRRLWAGGLRGILDYGLEDAVVGSACDRNLDEFLRTVEMTAALPPSSTIFDRHTLV